MAAFINAHGDIYPAGWKPHRFNPVIVKLLESHPNINIDTVKTVVAYMATHPGWEPVMDAIPKRQFVINFSHPDLVTPQMRIHKKSYDAFLLHVIMYQNSLAHKTAISDRFHTRDYIGSDLPIRCSRAIATNQNHHIWREKLTQKLCCVSCGQARAFVIPQCLDWRVVALFQDQRMAEDKVRALIARFEESEVGSVAERIMLEQMEWLGVLYCRA